MTLPFLPSPNNHMFSLTPLSSSKEEEEGFCRRLQYEENGADASTTVHKCKCPFFCLKSIPWPGFLSWPTTTVFMWGNQRNQKLNTILSPLLPKQVFSRDVLGSWLQKQEQKARMQWRCSECNGAQPDRIPPLLEPTLSPSPSLQPGFLQLTALWHKGNFRGGR